MNYLKKLMKDDMTRKIILSLIKIANFRMGEYVREDYERLINLYKENLETHSYAKNLSFTQKGVIAEVI